jgi:hypothetical protein
MTSWFNERMTGVPETRLEYIESEVHFSNAEIWKEKSSEEIAVLTQNDTATCGFPFKVGGRYLVFAKRTATLEASVSLCFRTQQAEFARSDIEAMRNNQVGRSNKTLVPTAIRLAPVGSRAASGAAAAQR